MNGKKIVKTVFHKKSKTQGLLPDNQFERKVCNDISSQ